MDVQMERTKNKRARFNPAWVPRDRAVSTRWSDSNRALYDEAFKGGNAEALNQLIRQNEPLIRRISNKYRCYGISDEELIQEGRVGYLKGLQRYQEGHGTNINTYAGLWVRATITEYVKKELRRRRTFFSYDRLTDRTSEDLCMIMNLDDPADFREGNQEVLLLMHEEVVRIRSGIARLNERERFIIQRRYGFDDDEGPWTLEEVGRAFTLTRERIRQIEAKALPKIPVTSDRLEAVASAMHFMKSCA